MSTPPPADASAAKSPDGLQILERLRGRIEAAAAEIERLRAENAALDARVRKVQRDVTGVSDTTYAVLGALAIAEELHLVRGELDRLRAAVGTEAAALADRLDAALER